MQSDKSTPCWAVATPGAYKNRGSHSSTQLNRCGSPPAHNPATHVQGLLWLVKGAVAEGEARPHIRPADLRHLGKRPALDMVNL